MNGRRGGCRRAGAVWLGSAAVVGTLLLGAPPSYASDKIELLVIGNNRPGPSADHSGAAAAPPAELLRYADDDAAAFYDFLAPLADGAHLLTVMDTDTAAAYPQLVETARAPERRELDASVAAMAAHIERNRQRGDHTAVFIFFSGHGSVGEGHAPELALIDGGITQDVLYEDVLSRLPADLVHVFVDACYAEAVVRPRDADAQPVGVSATDAADLLKHSTLARFPNVGAIVASAGDARAHEWDTLRHGIFTYELLSAMRGAADVNRDGHLEYSEVYAYLRAANRNIENPAARLAIVAHAPEVNRRATLLDFGRFPAGQATRLTNVPGEAGRLDVEDSVGRHILTFMGERDYAADLLLPAGRTLYVLGQAGEAQFSSRPGETVPFARLTFGPARERARGPLEDSVRRGLFSTPFGRDYYLGLVDGAGEFVAVPVRSDTPIVARSPGSASQAEVTPLAPTYRLIVAGGAATSVAGALPDSAGLRVGVRGERRGRWIASFEALDGTTSGATERRVLAEAGWAWTGGRTVRGWIGAEAGGGIIHQSTATGQAHWSGVLALGPIAGAALDVTRRVALFVEAEAPTLAYRGEDTERVSIAPAGWIGAALAF